MFTGLLHLKFPESNLVIGYLLEKQLHYNDDKISRMTELFCHFSQLHVNSIIREFRGQIAWVCVLSLSVLLSDFNNL